MTTCRRAGASKDATKRIIKKIRGEIYRGVSTREIYKLVLNALNEEENGAVLKQRYQLKESIMRLRPSGFLFEIFVSEILKYQGFKINKIRGKVKGKCIVHEIDLIISENSKKALIECKHHSKHGVYTGLKESLYTHARFLDSRPFFDKEYLICNTKVSNHAKKYAKCVKQQILSWKYPPNESLEKIIEKNHLYPITILNISRKEIDLFTNKGIILSKNLLDYSDIEMSKMTQIPLKRIQNLQKITQAMIA